MRGLPAEDHQPTSHGSPCNRHISTAARLAPMLVFGTVGGLFADRMKL